MRNFRGRLERLERRRRPEPISPCPEALLVVNRWAERAAEKALAVGRFPEWVVDQPKDILAYLLFLDWFRLGILTAYKNPADPGALWCRWRRVYALHDRAALLAECLRLAALPDPDDEDADHDEDDVPEPPPPQK